MSVEPVELFDFEWNYDQGGYELFESARRSALTPVAPALRIRPKGGPQGLYQPMERTGLWRRCAETCESADGVLAFVSEFGLLADAESESVEAIQNTSHLLRLIAHGIDKNDRLGAAKIFNIHATPHLTALIVRGRKGPEFKLHPLSLRAALLLQAGEAINGDRQFRKCTNCPEWFQIGTGARTARAKFCSDTCRVAWHSKEQAQAAASWRRHIANTVIGAE